MRYDCFNKLVGQASYAILLSKLPPTTEAAHQHILHIPPRANMARTAFEPIQLGMEVVNKSLTPIYTTKGPAPAKIVSLITCGCNKGCRKKCKCVRANLRCTTLCKNCRGQSCINTEAIDIVEEGDEEDNDII
ncbi:hypothetical protein AVEN_236239-1 [Araneus ventricosus]|uniref:Tesmin/TSO1-like CXC domain-containing protein n=1 Tax=Araneus ventricosus TaxID=182803 RepID=A0A4Y2CBR2_ARAVE|nr:hypothetical protein AVEN_236239-1 [Araneus ventricosus]